jgi:vWA-MoxR associated protein C-terminal domain
MTSDDTPGDSLPVKILAQSQAIVAPERRRQLLAHLPARLRPALDAEGASATEFAAALLASCAAERFGPEHLFYALVQCSEPRLMLDQLDRFYKLEGRHYTVSRHHLRQLLSLAKATAPREEDLRGIYHRAWSQHDRLADPPLFPEDGSVRERLLVAVFELARYGPGQHPAPLQFFAAHLADHAARLNHPAHARGLYKRIEQWNKDVYGSAELPRPVISPENGSVHLLVVFEPCVEDENRFIVHAWPYANEKPSPSLYQGRLGALFTQDGQQILRALFDDLLYRIDPVLGPGSQRLFVECFLPRQHLEEKLECLELTRKGSLCNGSSRFVVLRSLEYERWRTSFALRRHEALFHSGHQLCKNNICEVKDSAHDTRQLSYYADRHLALVVPFPLRISPSGDDQLAAITDAGAPIVIWSRLDLHSPAPVVEEIVRVLCQADIRHPPTELFDQRSKAYAQAPGYIEGFEHVRVLWEHPQRLPQRDPLAYPAGRS